MNAIVEQQIRRIQAKALWAPCDSCARETTFRLAGAPACPRCGGTEAGDVVWAGPPLRPIPRPTE